MATATLTSKGQLTIPKKVRDRLGLATGDRLEIHLRPDGVVEMVPRREDMLGLREMLKPQVKGVTLSDMEDAIHRGKE